MVVTDAGATKMSRSSLVALACLGAIGCTSKTPPTPSRTLGPNEALAFADYIRLERPPSKSPDDYHITVEDGGKNVIVRIAPKKVEEGAIGAANPYGIAASIYIDKKTHSIVQRIGGA